MKRLLLLFYLAILLAIALPPTRADIRQFLLRPDVQSAVNQYSGVGNRALVALMAYTKLPEQQEQVDTEDTWGLTHGCSLTAQQTDAILREYNSPAVGVGKDARSFCEKYNIDNAYWLAMFIQESTAGTNPAWAGRKPDGSYTANTGNIICIEGYDCYGRFADFGGDWSLGSELHFKLLACYRSVSSVSGGCSGLYTAAAGKRTLDEALNTWAPPVENDTNGYLANVKSMVTAWRSVQQGLYVADGEQGETLLQRLVAAPVDAYTAPPLALSGCLKTNVVSAYKSSPGLNIVSIAPGADWSFNENWQIDHSTLVNCGVYGGGVCNQASRYSNVARSLGLEVHSVYHGFVYDSAVPEADNLSIWSSGTRGGQDLLIKNNSDKTVQIRAFLEGDNLVVQGWKETP